MPDENMSNINTSTPNASTNSIDPTDTLIDKYRKPIEEKVGIPSDEASANVATEQITGKSANEPPPEAANATAEDVRETGHEVVNTVAPVAGKAAVAVGRAALAGATAGASEAVLATPVGKYAEKKVEGVVTNTVQNVGNQAVDQLTSSPAGKNGKLEGEDEEENQAEENHQNSEAEARRQEQQKQQEEEKKKKEEESRIAKKKKELQQRMIKLGIQAGLIIGPFLLLIMVFVVIFSPVLGGFMDATDGDSINETKITSEIEETTTKEHYSGGGTNNYHPGDHENHGDNNEKSRNDASGQTGPRTYPSGSRGEKFKQLFPDGVPGTAAEMQKYLTTISVPITTQDGTKTTTSVTVHKDIADHVLAVTKAAQDAGFKIYSIGCYNWRGKNNGSAGFSPSDHAYGLACDINPAENYSVNNGTVYAGKFYKPGENEYSMPENGVVVKTFRSYGWFWGGGDWAKSNSAGYYDYMHFSYGEQ